MVRPKRDWRRKSFSLDRDTSKLIKEGMNMEGFSSESKFIDFIVAKHFESSNPIRELDSIREKISKHEKRLLSLREMETEIINGIKFMEDWRRKNSQSIGKITQNIARCMLEKRYEAAERIATIQSSQLGVKKEVLLMNAQSIISKGI